MRIDEGFCPTLRPTRAAFEKPFCDYVREVFAKNPDLPCFKVGSRRGGEAEQQEEEGARCCRV